jgi:hypothetical protein
MGHYATTTDLLLIKISDSTTATAIESVRKLVAVFLSFYAFQGKQITLLHLVGVFVFFGGVFGRLFIKLKKKEEKQLLHKSS